MWLCLFASWIVGHFFLKKSNSNGFVYLLVWSRIPSNNSCVKQSLGVLFSFFNFYWSIVDLQCCVSFRCTAKWVTYTNTYIHSFLDSFPISVITEYWVEFPVLYSRSLEVTYFIYTSVYMSIPIFQFIPSPYLTPW